MTKVEIGSDVADAGVVRSWARGRLSKIPTELRAGVLDGARGRVHPEIVRLFEAANPELKYAANAAPKVERTATLTFKDSKTGRTRKATLPLAEIRALAGQDASTRGRISAATLEAAGAAYAKTPAAKAPGRGRTRRSAQKAAQDA